MEIRTLKDLKEALLKVPDKDLENFGAGINGFEPSKYVALLSWGDEEEFEKYWEEVGKKLDDVEKWIKNISKLQHKYTIDSEKVIDADGAGVEDMLSSKDSITLKD